MSDCSPLRLAENGHSPSQSFGSRNSQTSQGEQNARVSATAQEQGDVHNVNFREAAGQRGRSHSECSSKSGQLRYGARNVIELFIPVSLCMLIVVGTMKATDSYHYSSQSVIWYAQMMFTDQSVDTGTRVWQSFANAFIMLIFIVIMTTVLILLYKFRCYATIHGWLILSSLLLLFMFTLMYIAQILKVYNIPMDVYTLTIFVWNFGVVGMICIHWKGPLLLQQGYLIIISAFLALVFIRCLPDWTIWTVLAIVSVWDLVAVLCPRGPLRILVETAQERNESIFPALIYSSTIMWEIGSGILYGLLAPSIAMAERGTSNRSSAKKSGNGDRRRGHQQSVTEHRVQAPSSVRRDQHPVEIFYEDGAQPPEVVFIQPNMGDASNLTDGWQRPVTSSQGNRKSSQAARDRRLLNDGNFGAACGTTTSEQATSFNQTESTNESNEEERGVKLGLGDFIFFSVLVGKASSYGDWTITMSCYVSILVGLCLTLSLLAVFRKALPALPISIAFGLTSFFLSYMFVLPLSENLASNQIFV